MDLTMTPAERWAFLTEVPRVCVLSIDAPDRAPVSSPIWFSVENDAILFAVDSTSRKGQLLRGSGRTTFCVQSEELPYKYVTIEGPVEHLGTAPQEFRRAEAHRYLGPELGDLYIAGTADEVSELWSLQPQRWASADYSKIS